MNFDDHTATENLALLGINQFMTEQLCHPDLKELLQEEMSMVVAFAVGAFSVDCRTDKLKVLKPESLCSVFISHLVHTFNFSEAQAKELLNMVAIVSADKEHVLHHFAQAGIDEAINLCKKDKLYEMLNEQRKSKIS